MSNLVSKLNTIFPYLLALSNTYILWQMYSVIIAQNAILIDMISSSKNEIIDKVATPLPEAVIINSEADVWSTCAPYLILIGTVSVIIFGTCYYFYYVSNSNGVPPTDPSTGIKKLEKEFEETLPEMVEESKEGFIPHEYFDSGKEDILKGMSSLAEQLDKNSRLISTVGNEQLQIKRAISSLKLAQGHELQALTEHVDQLTTAIKNLYKLIGTYFKAT